MQSTVIVNQVLRLKLFICPKQETQEYTKTVVRYCLDTLQTWFEAIGFIDEVKENLKCFYSPCTPTVSHSCHISRSRLQIK